MDKRKIGLTGELLVNQALSGSKWLNMDSESKQNYDIDWNGILIDVKTTNRYCPSSRHAFEFYDSSSPKPENTKIIFVFVAITDGKNLCWVQKPKPQFSYYMKEKDSFPLSELEDKIYLLTQI